jgi:hypothetical protein
MPKLAYPVTPAEFSRTLAALAESLVPGVVPLYIDSRTRSGESSTNSHAVVARQVAAEGGESLLGWALWELPGVFAEAEFCAVWRSPEGQIFDIVPRHAPTRRVLFLPDAGRTYDGKDVGSVRRAAVGDPRLADYLATFDLEFELFSRGERESADAPPRLAAADVPAYERLIAQRIQLHQLVQQLYPEWGPYSPCWCGSGQKAKWCHGVQQQ